MASHPTPGVGTSAQPTAPTPAPQLQQEEKGLADRWLEFLTRPDVQAGLMQFSIDALQPPQPGQSTGGHLASSFAGGGQAVGRVQAQERAEDKEDFRRRGVLTGEDIQREDIAAQNLRQQRTTKGSLDVEGIRSTSALGVAGLRNKGGLAQAKERSRGGLAAAEIDKSGRIEAAGLRITADDNREARRIQAQEADTDKQLRSQLTIHFSNKRNASRNEIIKNLNPGDPVPPPVSDADVQNDVNAAISPILGTAAIPLGQVTSEEGAQGYINILTKDGAARAELFLLRFDPKQKVEILTILDQRISGAGSLELGVELDEESALAANTPPPSQPTPPSTRPQRQVAAGESSREAKTAAREGALSEQRGKNKADLDAVLALFDEGLSGPEVSKRLRSRHSSSRIRQLLAAARKVRGR